MSEFVHKKKIKAGIVTFYHGNYNFGGLLQAYALPTVLREHFGIEAEQIDYCPTNPAEEKKHQKTGKKEIRRYLYQFIYRFGIVFFDFLNKRNLNKRKQMFDRFMDTIPHSDRVFEYDSINECADRYHIIICGGDQIWNDYSETKNIQVYTLQFAPSTVKKIAYAPSMAILDTTLDFNRIMRNGLNQLDAISVREKKSLSILKELTEKEINIVVDPVLLMTENEWKRMTKAPAQKKKYILCYLLGDSIAYRKAITKMSQKMGLPVLTFPHINCNVVRKCDLAFGDIRDFESGPQEFPGLINGAEFVVTDSFHACVFSMIFEKPFVVLERNKSGEKGNMNSRIYDFLEEYHLENQLITEQEVVSMDQIPEVDFTYAHAHWKKRREESFHYLENVFKDN